jgi:ubiquinone biosynthesis protein Coq4
MLPIACTQFNGYQRLVRKLIEGLFSLVLIPAFRFWYGTARVDAQRQFLQSLPAGTVGRAVADLLAAHHFQLIPRYENHDLKHVLLGYAMTPDDELNLKAFMLGNGDWSLPSLGLSLLVVLTPEQWPTLWRHYQRGRRTPSIVRWKLADYATQNLANLRQQLGLQEVALRHDS